VKVREHNSEGEGFCAHDSAAGSMFNVVGLWVFLVAGKKILVCGWQD
jgi:hypothetical protein